MVKAIKGNMLILGLSHENLERLKADQPIKFNLKEFNMGDVEVFIFSAKDESEMINLMYDGIGPNTILK